MRRVNRAVIQHCLKLADNDTVRATDRLGLPRSTFNRRWPASHEPRGLRRGEHVLAGPLFADQNYSGKTP